MAVDTMAAVATAPRASSFTAMALRSRPYYNDMTRPTP
jgi:hypothetical protein